jgi:hypothetical protein
MLSERGNGFKIAMNALNVGRIKLAVATLDGQRRVLNEAVSFANQRVQFKTPIAKFGAIKQKLANMATFLYAGEAAGNSHQEAELKGVEEYVIECSILKVACSEQTQITADEGIQVMGGMGFSADMPMETAWRDTRIARIYEGTNEINRMLSVGMLIKKAMKGQLDLIGPATAVGDELLGIPDFAIPDFSEPMSQEKHILKNLKKVFLMIAGAGVQKYGTELEEHQQLLLAVADILIEVYMAESAVLRAEKNVGFYGLEAQEYQVALSQLYLYQAVEKITTKGREAILGFAEGDEQKALLMGLKRFTKYMEYPNVIALRNKVADKVAAENNYCF